MQPDLPPAVAVDTPALWSRCVAELRAVSQFAVDIESNSLHAYRERICLIQLSTRDTDYIVDPLVGHDLTPFGALLADPGVEKVFHAAEYDLILLQREHGWSVNNLFDTMWAARILGVERIGLASLLEDHYGVRLNKKHQRADWCRRPLKTSMLRYAQADTHYLLRLRDDLHAQLAAGGHLEEAAELFDDATHVRIPDLSFDPDGFWQLNGVNDLTPRQRAILRELYLFRDREAQRRDRAPFKVMGNRTLLELAQTAPDNVNALRQVHGMSHRQVRRYGDKLLRLVARGRQADLPKRPRSRNSRPPDDVLARYDALHQWRKERARARGVASDVVLSRDSLWEIARLNPQRLEELQSLDTVGAWRRRTYGPAIVDVVRSVNAEG